MLTKEQVVRLHEKFKSVVVEFAKEEDLNVKGVKLSYSTTDLNYKVELQVADENVAKEEFKRNAAMFGIKAEAKGATFTDRNVKYTIIDIVPSRRKYPVLVIDESGKRVLFTIQAVRVALPDMIL